MALISGGELVVRVLLEQGIDCTYLLYGGHLQPICESIRAHGMNYVDVRHEASAGYAAEGYARASGKFGVALVSAAAGYTNVLSSIGQAFTDRTPVVYISTSARLCDAETNFFMSGIDPVSIARPITKWAHGATATRDIPRLLSHAIRLATAAPTGPVLLDLPWDVVHGMVEESEVHIPKLVRPLSDPLPQPSLVEAALDILSSASRPIIIAGEGACVPGVAEELRAFVARSGIPVFSHYDGIGLLPADDPLYGGTVLKLTEFRGEQSPDAILALGVRFGFLTVGDSGIVSPAARVIHVDFDAKELGRTKDVEVPMVAGSREAMAALNAASEDTAWSDYSAWQAAVREAKAKRLAPLAAAADAKEASKPIPPFAAALGVVEAAGDDAIYVGDGADAHMWFAEILQQRPRNEPGGFFAHKSFFGCLGYGIGFAIGVQNVRPDKRVICVTGDGAVGFSLAEFHTLARHNVPVVVVVMNNQAWGATSHFQKKMTVFGTHNSLFATDLSGADYHDVASALGCYSVVVRYKEDIRPAMKEALASNRPACVNIVVGLEDIAPDHLNVRFTE